jgi:hypothetical protein
MKHHESTQRRRAMLQSAAFIPFIFLATNVAATEKKTMSHARLLKPGKPGEFNFLEGKWRIKNRKRKGPLGSEWDEFDGEATCFTILEGVCSVEELRIPARNFRGLGLRLFDVEKKVWNDFWVNSQSGVLTAPGTSGYFENGVGTFISEDTDKGKPVLYRGVWDEITERSCRWRQGASYDGGKTWDDSWIMQWTRA